MLILALKLSDGPIHIINEDTDEEGTIEFLAVNGNQLRMGFNFPKNHTILRDIPYQKELAND